MKKREAEARFTLLHIRPPADALKLADGLVEIHGTLDDDQRKEIQQMWD